MKKIRSVRVSDALWYKVKLKAKEEDKTVSEVIVEHLREYVKAQRYEKTPHWKGTVWGFFFIARG